MLELVEIRARQRSALRPAPRGRTAPLATRSASSSNMSLEEQRRNKRDYMRRWRAAPKNRKREQQARCRAWLNRKLNGGSERSRRVCAFCNHRKSVTTVSRLSPLRVGFVEVRLPYCGEC